MLKAWRKRCGLTQETAAHEICASVHTLRQWEQGLGKPARHTMFLILKLIGENPNLEIQSKTGGRESR